MALKLWRMADVWLLPRSGVYSETLCLASPAIKANPVLGPFGHSVIGRSDLRVLQNDQVAPHRLRPALAMLTFFAQAVTVPVPGALPAMFAQLLGQAGPAGFSTSLIPSANTRRRPESASAEASSAMLPVVVVAQVRDRCDRGLGTRQDARRAARQVRCLSRSIRQRVKSHISPSFVREGR